MKNKVVIKLILFLGDIVTFYLCLWLTLLIRFQALPTQTNWHIHFLSFSGIFIIWLIAFYIDDFYDVSGTNSWSFIARTVRILFINLVTTIIYFYFLTNWVVDLKPQTVLFLYVFLFFPIFILWRNLCAYIFTSEPFSSNLAIIVTRAQIPLLEEILKQQDAWGYKVTLLLGLSNEDLPQSIENVHMEVLTKPEILPELVEQYKISTIITALHSQQYPELVEAFMSCLPLKLGFVDFPHFYENHTGKVPLSAINHIWFLQNFSENEKKFYEFTKGFLDRTFAIMIGILTAPLMPLIALMIKLESKGPILYSQERVGKYGHRFQVYKFRSMKIDAESAGPQWASEKDPRITRVGNFIRKTRLDELPQIYNVLKGEMSLIGPRPERPEFVDLLQKDISFYKERLLVKPGLTGWAQINFPYGASKEDSFQKLQFDIYYIKHRSFTLDMSIILKTVRILLGAKGR